MSLPIVAASPPSSLRVLQAAGKQAELERLTALLESERMSTRAEKAASAALKERLEGAVGAIALLEAKAAGFQKDASKDAAAMQVR